MNFAITSAVFDSYRPALVPLTPNLLAAAFPLMKIYPAEYCLRRAREEGLVTSDTLVVETSSGTMALGLAIACRWHGHALSIVTDPVCDASLRRRLESLGATVDIVASPSGRGGYQQARLDRVHAIRAARPAHWWLNQYDNAGNPEAYAAFAAQVVEAVGRVDAVVACVGSGGSICGTVRYLRMLFPEVQAIAVDTFGSVLFGQPDRPRRLRGLGNSLLPGNLDHTLIDEIHWVSAPEAYTATRRLHYETTLYRGPTSGACWIVAQEWAARHRDLRVVCLLPDDGSRYADTLYCDEFLRREQLWIDELPSEPLRVDAPADAIDRWCWMPWNRRSYAQVAGTACAAAP
jgi:cysteine synthase